MAGIHFLSENQIDNATLSITTGAANAQFPLSNIQNDSPSIKFRSTGNTVVILADMTTTRTVDAMSIVGDPTGTFGVTAVEFKFSLTTDFSGSTAHNATLNSENNFGFKLLTSAETARYAQITLTGTGSFSELSNVFVGEAINLTNMNLSIPSFNYGHDDQSTIKTNRYGQRFIDTRNKIKNIAGSLEFLNATEQDQIETMIRAKALSKPLWIIVDSAGVSATDAEYKFSMYGYLTDMPEWSAAGNFHYNTSISMQEAI